MTSLDVTSTLQSDEFLSLMSAGPQQFISFSVSTDKYRAEPGLKLPLSSSALRGPAHTGAGSWHHRPFSNHAGMSSLTRCVCVLCWALQGGFSHATSSNLAASPGTWSSLLCLHGSYTLVQGSRLSSCSSGLAWAFWINCASLADRS